jgi:dCMP deaminase
MNSPYLDPFYEMGIRLAATAQRESEDPSTQIGVALCIVSDQFIVDCNRMPVGISTKDPDRWVRPLKNSYVEHAERNVIYTAAREGLKTDGGTLFMIGMGKPTFPCDVCARAIIGAGIKKVVALAYKPLPERWDSTCNIGGELLAEKGVEFVDLGDEYLSILKKS